jgi:hypothetical protein
MKSIAPDEFKYLIRKTVTYLEFHNDDSAKEIAAQWRHILAQIHQIEQQQRQPKRRS